MDFQIGTLLNDPSFLGAIVGAISGLAGAILGGAATYYASVRQYRTEHKTRQNAALAATLIEICRNQFSLIRELDRALPLWLSRCHHHAAAENELHEVTSPIPKCETRIYDTFFPELIPSSYGSELKTYYGRLSYINQLSQNSPQGLSPEKFGSYVETLALAAEIAIDIADELHQHVSKTMPKKWGKEDDFGAFNEQRDWTLDMAALRRTKLSDLESYFDGKKSWPPALERIQKKSKGELDGWMVHAQNLYQKCL